MMARLVAVHTCKQASVTERKHPPELPNPIIHVRWVVINTLRRQPHTLHMGRIECLAGLREGVINVPAYMHDAAPVFEGAPYGRGVGKERTRGKWGKWPRNLAPAPVPAPAPAPSLNRAAILLLPGSTPGAGVVPELPRPAVPAVVGDEIKDQKSGLSRGLIDGNTSHKSFNILL